MGDSENRLKKALTYDKQLYHLINDKKLRVLNEKNALNILKRENYYRLSGYWINHLDNEDHFYSYITFEEIYKVYKFDKVLRGILLEMINDVEVYFKTRLSNFFTLKYGADGYLNNANFQSKINHKKMIDKIDELKNKNPNNLIVSHHNKKYGGIMPLWVSVELMSFGTVSKMFSNFKNEDKKKFTNSSFTNLSYIYLESFYHGITYFRNQNCHFQRLYDVKHNIKIFTYKTDFYKPITNKTTFYYIFVLMLLNPNLNLGKRLIFKLNAEFKKTKIDKNKYGFPYEWKEILEKANGYCINA